MALRATHNILPWRPKATLLISGSRCLSAAASPIAGSGQATPGSNALDTVDNETIARLAAKPLHSHGRPPLSTSSLLDSANFSLSLIPIRLAHRLKALRNLPFIVVSNPHIARIYNIYMHSLSTLVGYSNRTIQSLEEEEEFTKVMADLVQTHNNTIPILARGFLESRRCISPAAVTQFLDEHLRARIGTRLIAEQHIALHLSSQPHCGSQGSSTTSKQYVAEDTPSSQIGVIDTALKISDLVRNCESWVGELCELTYGVRPSVIINGQPETKLAYVPTHLEYIITELLKNAFRATVEKGHEKEAVEVTIAGSAVPYDSLLQNAPISTKRPLDVDNAASEEAAPGVTIRIRDRGGGIPPAALPNIWAYSFTTFDSATSSAPSPFSHQYLYE
ncbi:uncharacterized protein KY384_007372 [Bacidia gigantensis]|uniref:uncharacterized protein n=1 Tax=Bacidia gigantensis TaxID=2732470 RepID=UPI001D05058C|nr:uncharacterized protein KY384_007372 [Bacidia gigantensis]KAG8528454.1 hypothetical protein KY384_007372 [Bacidia gigantensis]